MKKNFVLIALVLFQFLPFVSFAAIQNPLYLRCVQDRINSKVDSNTYSGKIWLGLSSAEKNEIAQKDCAILFTPSFIPKGAGVADPDCPRGQVYDPRIKSCGTPQELFIERSGATDCLNTPAKVRFEKAPGVKKGLIIPEMTIQAGDIIHIPPPPRDWLVTYESKEKGGRDHYWFSEGGTKLQIPCHKKAAAFSTLMYLIDGSIKFVTPPDRLKPTKYDIEAQNSIVGVEGTEFIIESSKEKDSIYVIDGKVSVLAKQNKSAAPVVVLPGQMVSVTLHEVNPPQSALASNLIKDHPSLFAEKSFADFSPADSITKLRSEPLEKSGDSFKYYLGAVVAVAGILIFRSWFKKKKP